MRSRGVPSTRSVSALTASGCVAVESNVQRAVYRAHEGPQPLPMAVPLAAMRPVPRCWAGQHPRRHDKKTGALTGSTVRFLLIFPMGLLLEQMVHLLPGQDAAHVRALTRPQTSVTISRVETRRWGQNPNACPPGACLACLPASNFEGLFLPHYIASSDTVVAHTFSPSDGARPRTPCPLHSHSHRRRPETTWGGRPTGPLRQRRWPLAPESPRRSCPAPL
jgi:hypothetical protein